MAAMQSKAPGKADAMLIQGFQKQHLFDVHKHITCRCLAQAVNKVPKSDQASDLLESLILLVPPALCSACQVAGHPTRDAAGLGKQGAIKGGYLVPFGTLTP